MAQIKLYDMLILIKSSYEKQDKATRALQGMMFSLIEIWIDRPPLSLKIMKYYLGLNFCTFYYTDVLRELFLTSLRLGIRVFINILNIPILTFLHLYSFSHIHY